MAKVKCNPTILTVIVPVFNMKTSIEQCLNSILNQSFKNLNILCIDDCSTDGTDAILDKYQSVHRNITVEHFNKNRQLGYSRNFALQKVETEYVTFVDADDWVDTQAYAKCIQKLGIEQSDIAIFGIKNEYENKKQSQIRYEYADNYIEGNFALSLLCDAFSQDIAISPIVNNKIYRTEFLKSNNIRFAEMAYYEDMPFSYATLRCAHRVSLVGNSFYHYYQNPKSKLHNITKLQLANFCEALKIIYVGINCEDKNETKLFFSFLDKSLGSLVERIDNFIDSSDEKKELLVYLLSELTNNIPLKSIVNYIDVQRIIRAIRMTY